MRGHNICFCLEISKIIFELFSVLPLIWSCDALQDHERFGQMIRLIRVFELFKHTMK